ncbi:hypothetical protein GGQ74_001140 [Desulfobaculum xiamenense]|uniref:Uncharacterized protein n=1 Tax=Desulfobaculum xiamenense TaxID=995050 RepID=A0A846QKB7_9BACT|nr:hypothetical protein [Desulfobaculum xiamenense]NJB67500.1 hypothetical protein [Desulfobaculum xiamenense]
MDYAAEARSVEVDLREAGMPMTLRRLASAAYDPATGRTGATAVEQAGFGLFKSRDIQGSGETFIDGSMVRQGDRFVLLGAHSVTTQPEPGDELVAGGTTYTVVNAKAVDPGGVPVLFKLQVRR